MFSVIALDLLNILATTSENREQMQMLGLGEVLLQIVRDVSSSIGQISGNRSVQAMSPTPYSKRGTGEDFDAVAGIDEEETDEAGLTELTSDQEQLQVQLYVSKLFLRPLHALDSHSLILIFGLKIVSRAPFSSSIGSRVGLPPLVTSCQIYVA